MTISRVVGLLVALASVGIAVVAIRIDQASSRARIQQLQFRQTELHRRIWSQEAELARLMAPDLVRERAADLSADGAQEQADGGSRDRG